VGLFWALAVASIGVYGILMASWSSANKYALMGGLRAAGQLIAYELPLILAVMGVVIQAETLNLQGIVAAQHQGEIFGWGGIGNPFIFTQFIGFLIFVISIQAEVAQAPFDMPHAETEALRMAGTAADGATAYVSLEPCSHHGRTPPCAEALVAAGIERVVTAIEDPDPRVKGAGHAKLRAAGLKVETGLLAEEARRDLSGFLSRVTRGRPHVLLKLARSSDGMIAEAPGQRTSITGEEANLRTHLMRAKADAIMVGIRTVRADDPHLTCRLPGLEHRSPVAIVVDGGLTI
jgi:pyrimidine deaminase RibD-like protein